MVKMLPLHYSFVHLKPRPETAFKRAMLTASGYWLEGFTYAWRQWGCLFALRCWLMWTTIPETVRYPVGLQKLLVTDFRNPTPSQPYIVTAVGQFRCTCSNRDGNHRGYFPSLLCYWRYLSGVCMFRGVFAN